MNYFKTIDMEKIITEQEVYDYFENKNEHWFLPKCEESFKLGVKYALQKTCKSLYEQLPQDEGIALLFCEHCREVVVYSENDMCNACGEVYNPELEICPNCESNDYTGLCSKCGEELDCDYLSDILSSDLCNIEWVNIDDLETIKNYLKLLI